MRAELISGGRSPKSTFPSDRAGPASVASVNGKRTPCHRQARPPASAIFAHGDRQSAGRPRDFAEQPRCPRLGYPIYPAVLLEHVMTPPRAMSAEFASRAHGSEQDLAAR